MGKQSEKTPIPAIYGHANVAEKILSQRKGERGFHFFMLRKNEAVKEAMWHPTTDFVDQGGTISEIWQRYLQEKDILTKLH